MLQHTMKKDANLAARPAILPLAGWLLIISCTLGACTGGTGSGDGESIAGTDLTSDTAELAIPIFYVKRTLPLNPLSLEDPYAFNPGAQLYGRVSASVSSPEVNISARIHGDNLNYDVKDLEISPDGTRLLFSIHPPEVDPDNPVLTWEVWEYNLLTDNLKKVISDDYIAIKGVGNDFNASYLPLPDPNNPDEIAIVFSSTRQDANRALLPNEFKAVFSGLEEDSASNNRDLDNGALQAVTLHTYDESIPVIADRMQQITFNQSHDIDPLVLPSGKILYSRWDNIANRSAFSLYQINPDGTQNTLMYGYHSHSTAGTSGGEGIVYNLQPVANGRLLGLLRERDLDPQILGGAIIELDIQNYIDRITPTFANTGLLNPAFGFISDADVLTDNQLSPGGRFSAIKQLNDGTNRMLVSWAPCLISGSMLPCASDTLLDDTTLLYGIWLLTQNGSDNTLLPIIVGDAGFMYTDIVIAETRSEPLSIITMADNLIDSSSQQPRAILNIKSIYDIDGVDTATGGISAHADPALTDPATIEAKFLRLVKAVSIPDESVREFDNTAFGINRLQLMREIVGYLPIEPDGSVRGLVPANVPLMIDVVDAEGKRISGRHQNWLTFGANETFECIGCHTAGSPAPHGRLDAQPLSVNPGAPSPGIFPNTVQTLGQTGLTMAESYAQFILPAPIGEPREREPVSDLSYIDEWTDDSGSLTKATPFTINYENLTTANPEGVFCKPWTPLCRIVINYETHIQPIWEISRTAVDDGSGNLVTNCVGCHTTNNGARVAAGQLDLTPTASVDEADHLTAYRELLLDDAEEALNGGAIADRRYECEIGIDIMGNPITQITAPVVSPAMSTAGANSSDPFFRCMTNDNTGDAICRSNVGAPLPGAPMVCTELGGDPLVSEPIINHNGMLSAEELRLIAEWLDLGAQYYNNPFDAPTP